MINDNGHDKDKLHKTNVEIVPLTKHKPVSPVVDIGIIFPL